MHLIFTHRTDDSGRCRDPQEYTNASPYIYFAIVTIILTVYSYLNFVGPLTDSNENAADMTTPEGSAVSPNFSETLTPIL